MYFVLSALMQKEPKKSRLLKNLQKPAEGLSRRFDHVLRPCRAQDSKPSSHQLLESIPLPPLCAKLVLSSQRLQALLVF